MSWEGPHKIGDYLYTIAHSPWKRPPEAPGVYIVSEKPWHNLPAEADRILYVGQAAYLRHHIGRLMCDLFGFTGDNPSAQEAYQHRGGHSLWRTIAYRTKSSRRSYISGGAENVSASPAQKPSYLS